MRLQPAVLGFLMWLTVSPCMAATTYGDTRAVPKENPPDESGPSGNDDEDNDGSSGWDFSIGDGGSGGSSGPTFRLRPGRTGVASCFALEIDEAAVGDASLGSTFGMIFFIPFWYAACPAAYSLIAGPIHVAIGNDQTEDRVNSRRYGLGFHVGWDWFTQTSYGPGTGGHLEAVGPLMRLGRGSLDFRLRAEGALSAQSMQIDYERFVFQDSMQVGVERDRMDGYSRWAFPITAELLWHPGTLGFYLGAGAGASWLYESVDLHRTTPVPGGSGDFSLSRGSWSPIAAFAIGREGIGSHGKPNWYFEIRWQAQLLEPRRRSSFPADNAFDAHSLGWVWGWYL